MADYYRFHPPWWVAVRVLKSCYTFAKECTAYTLPNKGMVTQQREVSLSLSLSIPPWHNAICSTYFRPVAFFRFYPRLFSTPRPHIIHSFQPLAPFLSPFSPSSLDSRGNNRGASFVAHSNLRQKTPAKPLAETYVFGRWLSLRFIESVTLGSLMIIRDGKKGPVFFPGNIFKRYFRDILSKSC